MCQAEEVFMFLVLWARLAGPGGLGEADKVREGEGGLERGLQFPELHAD